MTSTKDQTGRCRKNAANLVKTTAKLQLNYWSPLACLVNAQEDNFIQNKDKSTIIKMALSAQVDYNPINKVAVHWAQKTANRIIKKTGVLDLGGTCGAGPEENKDALEDTGEQ